MKTSIYNQKAEVVGEVELNPAIFEVKANKHLVAEAVRVQQSSSRMGLAHTKTRADVSGGGKKPWKQKGTGRARAGSNRSPIWRHGGVTFGPRNDRNWELKINKKAKNKALFMTLSDKAALKRIVILDSLAFDEAKTKNFVKVLEGLVKLTSPASKKQLFLIPKSNLELTRTMRNVPSVTSMVASNLNVVDVLKADTLFVLKDSLVSIEKTFLKAAAGQVKA